jgi:uncharacterized protein YycO
MNTCSRVGSDHQIFVAAYRGRSLLSRLIQWRTWSGVSHVACIKGDGQVVEAWGGSGPRGVRHFDSWHRGHTPGTNIDLFLFRGLSDGQAREFWDFQMSKVGAKYDYLGVLGFVARRSALQCPFKWFCSELVHAASVAAQAPLLVGTPSYKVSPGDIVKSPVLEYAYTVTAPGK